jgi:hypothetical protein
MEKLTQEELQELSRKANIYKRYPQIKELKEIQETLNDKESK